ncbi:MAG: SDR family NAD(P)-dependent oxidoreductase, partial [Nocardioides sp.]|nr:SDR family NAD(P)-dependent oxidoreductase [Nocardioides sp.]
MDLGLDNAVALVTGGSKGIGKACARALLAEGAKVAILARGEDALKAAAEELGDVLTVSADTTDSAAVEAAVEAVVSTYGRLDVIVNAAAEPASSTPGGGSGLAAVDEADIIRQVDTKGLGYLRVVRAALPHLKAAGGGRVVNIAGMNARTT